VGRPCRRAAAGLLAAVLPAGVTAAAGAHTAAPAAAASAPVWRPWRHLPGVFDLAGPRSDGDLVAAAAGGRLWLVPPRGAITPLTSGPVGSGQTGGAEASIALSPGLDDPGDGCRFARDDVFVLDLGRVPGVMRVGRDGRVTPFASVPGAATLTGIVFDLVGRFGHRLLVGGPAAGGDGSVVAGVDCHGRAHLVGRDVPAFEGGVTVAPPGFGAHGGELIVPDEQGGRLIAVTPSGESVELAASGTSSGEDIDVESVGVIPAGGAVLVADRGTPGSSHPGTDSILRLDAPALAAARVLPGDLLAAAEGGAVTVDLRCAAQCTVRTVATGPPGAHVEGHLVALGPVPGLAGTGGPAAGPGGPAALLAGAALLGGGLLARTRLRRRSAGASTAP
jgi:hypothetical protein